MTVNPSHRHRINRVIDFARHSEDAVLSLDQMADVACLSRYHFSRVFSSICGETPVEYVRRNNLESSIIKLVHTPALSITEIGLESGFSDAQGFSHAFRRRFGIGPKKFRDMNIGALSGFPNDQRKKHALNMSPPSEISGPEPGWHISLRYQPELRLAYVRNFGSYCGLLNDPKSSNGLHSAFEALANWAHARGVWPGPAKVIGICPSNPILTPPGLCQYDVSIQVDESIGEDETVSIQHMPSTQIAMLEMRGDLATLMRAWQWLANHWVPQNNLEVTGQVPFEIYHSRYPERLYPDYGVTLCTPVTRRTRSGFHPHQSNRC